MTTLREAAQQALEGLEKWQWDKDPRGADAYITALRAALAQQAEPYAAQSAYWAASNRMSVDPVTGNVSIGAQQAEPVEPVAWLTPGQDLHLNNGEGFRFSDWTPLYTAPPQRKPLTEEQAMLEIWQDVPGAVNFGITPKAEPPCPDCHGIGYDASGQLCACQENPSF